MTSYFPILPIILDEKLPQKLFASTDFLNHVSNYREENQARIRRKPVFLGTYKLEDGAWHLVSVSKCKYGKFLSLKRDSMNVSSDQMVVSLAKYIDSFPEQLRYLPKPDSLRIDSSPVAERASLNYHFKNNATSYQGEYPFQMTCLKKGSFWSFNLLEEKLTQSQDYESFLILMNINRDAHIHSEVDLEVYHPNNIEEKLHLRAIQNGYTILNLRKTNFLHPENNPHDTLFLQCRSCVFIPMILNVNKITAQLALEHTHPPSELLWGPDNLTAAQLIKKTWLS